MTIEVVTIGVDGSITPETIPNGCEALQQRVGGWIEAVASDDGEVTLWVNEEGKLMGLPVNALATQLWYLVSPSVAHMDVLCGPVVVSGGADSDGETLPIPTNLRRALDEVSLVARFEGLIS